jgi:hypothetical protein
MGIVKFFDGTSLNFTIPIQEGEEDQLRDEAITRNITELVNSAFSGPSSGSKPNKNSGPAIEVQQVTVYVDERPHKNQVNGEIITNDQTGPLSNFPRVDSVRHEGSISIKTATVPPSSSALSPNQFIDNPKLPTDKIRNGNDNGAPGIHISNTTPTDSQHLLVGENTNNL